MAEPGLRSPGDDRAIVLGLRQGDPATLDLLIDRLWAPLITYAANLLTGWDDAEDIVQEAFVRLWERRESWATDGSIQALLFQITRNLALDRTRQRRRRLRLLEGWKRDDPRRPSPTPAMELSHSLLKAAYESALAELPARRREVFLLSRESGLTYREIAAVMEISPQTVANQMSAALADLRCALEPFLEDS